LKHGTHCLAPGVRGKEHSMQQDPATQRTRVTDTLRSCFGFETFRPGQAEAILSLLAGQHTLVVMPTGAGKSLIYQLTALHRPGLTLVLSPLIALMKDQVDSLVAHGIPATCINSALSAEEQAQRLRALGEGALQLAYVAPERLRSVPFQEALSRVEVGLLAVDAAHCISQWGHDFRPDYLHIGTARESLGQPLTAALTATATPRVQGDIVRLLGIPSPTFVSLLTSRCPARSKRTIRRLAVLGSGLRNIHPRENLALAEVITQRGALVSEVRPDTPPSGPSLMARDRITSGLARAVIVVEAQERSGSLDTASRARRQGRWLLAVPGSPGTDALIAQGAGRLNPAALDFDALGDRIRARAVPGTKTQLGLWSR
jgi:hypothetical protein